MAKNRDINSPLSNVSFKCGSCSCKFSVAPARVEDAPERDHPYRYFAECTDCGEESKQATWEQALMASYGKHTGPKTEEGKKATAANLEGHPTPEEALRTRFNAMKHGLRARVATYFPAKPGQYPHCQSCQIDWDDCRAQVACMKRTELFMRHQIAFESKDPTLLTDIRSDLQANIQAIIDDIILAVASDGVVLKTPKYHFDKEGDFHLAEYTNSFGEKKLIEEVNAHPLLKVLSEFISRNSMSLGDMGMTAKVVDNQEAVMGNLDAEKTDRQTLLGYQQQQTNDMSKLMDMIERSKKASKEDPHVIEHTGG